MSNVRERVEAWIHRENVWGFLVSVVVLALISFFFFYPDAQQGNQLQQNDIVQGLSNGHETQQFEAETGHKAMWTNALFSGMPTFQISPSYDSNKWFDWIGSVLGLGLPSPCNLLMVMMLGMLILLMVMRCRWYWSLIGAVAWGFSSYFIILIGAGHIWKFMALMYVAPTIAGLILAYRGRYLAGGVMMALSAMMQLGANHPQMSYYFALLMGAMVVGWLVEAIRQKTLKRWFAASGVSVVAGVLALCANLPALYTTNEYGKETVRSQSELAKAEAKDQTGGMAYDGILAYSYYPTETFTLFIPNVKGGASVGPKPSDTPTMEQGGLTGLSVADLVDPEEAMSVSVPMTERQYQNWVGYVAYKDHSRLDAALEPAQDGEEVFEITGEYLLALFPQYFQSPGEGTNGPVYVGALIFALFVVGCIIVKGPVKWAMLVMTILSVMLAWGYNFTPLSDLFIYYFPLYSKFRAPESMLVVAEFTMPVLAILALQKIVGEGVEAAKRYKKIIIYSFGAIGLICLLGALVPSIFGGVLSEEELNFAKAYPEIGEVVESERLGLVRTDCIRSLFIVGLGLGLLLAWVNAKIKEWMLAGGVGLIVLIDLWSVDKRYVCSSLFYKTEASTEAVLAPDAIDNAIMEQAKASGLRHYRVADFDNLGGAKRSYHHSSIGGYHAAKLRRYDDLLNHTVKVEDGGRTVDVPPIHLPWVMDMLNTRYIIHGNQVSENPEALGNAWVVSDIRYVDGAQAEFDALATLEPAKQAVADKSFASALKNIKRGASGSVTLTSYAPDRLTYKSETAGEAIVVFSEIYFPWGWKATVDGKEVPLARVNYVLRALTVPGGSHEIVLTFDPESIHVTTNIAYVAIALIYLSLLLALGLWIRREFFTGKEA